MGTRAATRNPLRPGRRRTAAVAAVAVLALALGACGDDDEKSSQTGGEIGLTDTGGPTVAAGDCAGLKNGIGVTDTKITIANASDISGLVPGLFKDAQQAVRAYVAYFNAGQEICGRKLEYLPLDSRLDAGGDQQAAQQACEKAFAMVGSMSAFDSGGASAVSGCGIPDLRVATVTPSRLHSKVTYAVNSLAVNLVPGVVPQYFLKTHHEATQHAAFLYLNAGSGLANGKSQIAAYKKAGYTFIYEQAIDPLDVNYTPYILEMKNRGVQYVQFVGDYNSAARLAKVMAAQQFKPDVYLLDSEGYDFKFVRLAGPAGEGTRLFTNSALLEEASSNEEMRRYIGWLGKVAPNSYPTYFGMFAWSAARLFTEQAIQLGGRLDRASLLAALAEVDGWDGHGLFTPQAIGKRTTSGCTTILRLQKGKWVRESEGKFICGPIIDSGYTGT
jgi:ABC-type branched-subunit amino acid transport system substrate-binding protein